MFGISPCATGGADSRRMPAAAARVQCGGSGGVNAAALSAVSATATAGISEGGDGAVATTLR